MYPGGIPIPPPTGSNVTYKWIDSLGGGKLSGPIKVGTLRPDGSPAHGGVATYDADGNVKIEYHRH